MFDPNTMADMIARISLLWLNFFFIIRLFVENIYLDTAIEVVETIFRIWIYSSFPMI
ncbi:hypothetical protein OAC09_04000 [Amylibacter sp.]|nr:hypothetical protein [Amylibacter sp.]